MALPVTIPNTFANATSSIPLSQLDTNFSTLANAVNGLNSGSETLANLKATTANVGVLTVTGNATIGDASTDTVTLNSTLTANTAVIFAAGTSAAPSITTTGDLNTGIFFPAADTIAFTEGGSEAMRIDSSGNVGIGTSSPNIYSSGTYKRITLSDSANAGYGILTVAGGSGGGGEIDFGNQTIRQAAIATLDGSILGFYTNATNSGSVLSERMRIDSSGNVLIGTTTASGYSLGSVYNATTRNPGFVFQNSTTGQTDSDGLFVGIGLGGGADASSAYFYHRENGPAVFATNNTERMRINAGAPILCLSGGNTTATGTGIAFPATQSASTDANTLDDYEEGTWTVSVIGGTTAGTTTYGDSRTGWYRKIGSQVTVWYYVNVLSATGTGGISIGTLPFTLNSSSIQSAGPVMTNKFNWTTTNGSIVSYAGTSNQYLLIYASSDDAGWVAQSIVNEEFDLIGTHTYFTGD